MNDRRSIQDIIPPARSRPIRPQVVPPTSAPPPATPPPQPPQPPTRPPEENFMMSEPPRRSSWPFIAIAAGAVVVVAVVVGLMSTVFHTASAAVVVSEWKSDISGTYTAAGTDSGATDQALTYSPLTLEERASKTVAASGSAQAEDRAMGTIVVSNMSTQQRLITNTRFESKDGLIYRIHSPIVVPGAVTKNGVKTAGTIEAVVYADEAGEKYNIGLTDFTVPGLKNSPQYTLVTAKSKTPMSGGFVGMRATVEKSVRDAAVQELKAELDRTLRDKVRSSSPQGAVVFADSVDLTYREEPDKADGNNAVVTVVGTALAPAFPADALVRELSSHAQIAAAAPLELVNAGDITYSAGPGGNVQAGGAISFTLSGVAHLRAIFDPGQLAADLAGKTEGEIESVRSAYQSLVGPITLEVYPFWISSLPTNPSSIEVEVTGALDQQP